MRPGACLLAGLLALTSACSNVRHTYRQSGYDVLGKAAVKRVAVVGWAPQTEAGLGEVVAAVAADLIKLRKNYIVVGQSAGYAGRWSMACDNNVQGVFVVRALRAAAQDASKVQLHLAMELLRCSDGALLFRNEARACRPSHEGGLAALTANYEAALGPEARTFAAPSFTLLQQMVAQLPDPVLNDAEVEEKIELGQAGKPRKAATYAAQQHLGANSGGAPLFCGAGAARQLRLGGGGG